ncbi:hypothetical protein [Lysinibacillus sp. UGB7]|uniref:hypothetical protein n=1 Tax=Lysinibacillus TaxID=400634 RepID=UPI003B7641C7
MSKGKYKPLANVEFGFKPEEKEAFRQLAKQITTKVDRNTTWLEPNLNCKVQHLEKTNTGSLRTVSFKGFSFEKTKIILEHLKSHS